MSMLPPVIELQYQTPYPRARPDVLTAIGVISIIVASLSGLSNAGSVLSTAAFFVISSMNVPATATTVVTSGSTTGPTTTVTALNPLRMSLATMLLNGCVALANLAAAIVLLVGGIQLFRNSRSAKRLHLLFVCMKIPLVVIGAVASWMWFSSFASAATVGRAAMSWYMVIPALAGALVSLVYPLTLILVFSSRSVRAYFESLDPVPVS